MPERSIANAENGPKEGVCDQHKPRNPSHRVPKPLVCSPRTKALELTSQVFAIAVGQSLVTCAWIARSSSHLRRGVRTLMLKLRMLLLLCLLLNQAESKDHGLDIRNGKLLPLVMKRTTSCITATTSDMLTATGKTG